MHKANAYKVLAQELDRWRSMPREKLVLAVGQPAVVSYASVEGETIAIDVTLHWQANDRTAIRITAIANGPSHWRLDRLEESIVVLATES